jgi:hypothetical protein
VPESEAERFHFTAPLDDPKLVLLCEEQAMPFCAGSVARDGAFSYFGTRSDQFPVEMAIGPFSLTTRPMAELSAMTSEAVVRRAGDDRKES